MPKIIRFKKKKVRFGFFNFGAVFQFENKPATSLVAIYYQYNRPVENQCMQSIIFNCNIIRLYMFFMLIVPECF